MIVVRSPLRRSLGGGGTDLPSFLSPRRGSPRRGGDRSSGLDVAFSPGGDEPLGTGGAIVKALGLLLEEARRA